MCHKLCIVLENIETREAQSLLAWPIVQLKQEIDLYSSKPNLLVFFTCCLKNFNYNDNMFQIIFKKVEEKTRKY